MNRLYLTRMQRVFARLRELRRWHDRWHSDIAESIAHLIAYAAFFACLYALNVWFERLGI